MDHSLSVPLISISDRLKDEGKLSFFHFKKVKLKPINYQITLPLMILIFMLLYESFCLIHHGPEVLYFLKKEYWEHDLLNSHVFSGTSDILVFIIKHNPIKNVFTYGTADMEHVILFQPGLTFLSIHNVEINGPEDEIWLRKEVNLSTCPVLPLRASKRAFIFSKNLLHLLFRPVFMPA